jgi:hypothetical protein
VTAYATTTVTAAQAGATVTATATTTVTAAPKTVTAPTQAAVAPTPKAATPQSILNVTGNGAKTTANFTVTASQWAILYVFDCHAFGQAGNFSVDVYNGDGSFDDYGAVNALALTGNDNTVEHGAGTYFLEVDSECSWHIQVGQ